MEMEMEKNVLKYSSASKKVIVLQLIFQIDC